ncbi:hypothetical protein FFLO_01403 [Filobasidium floriforme]|uniref:Amidohydrolase 3 domain-containing protein n=1 Tax=Filobasidium floriforme TaxID=5210 RepID=A0A8K0JRD3_9TREE|nr:hypothetical protein FFLO_01403 [Filobasidium floriforme]
MSEQNPFPESAHSKDEAPAQSVRPARTPQAAPAASTVFTPFNFLLISGLAYLVLQSSEYKLDSTELFQKGLTYFSEFTANGGSGSGSGSGLGLYAICSREGNQIYTSELDTPQVQCVLVNNDTIIGLGAQALVEETAASLESDSNPSTKDLQVYYLPESGIMTPGFTDSHAHTLQYGHAQLLNLAGIRSVDGKYLMSAEVIRRLETYVDENREAVEGGAWIEGQGWDQTLWEGKQFPTAADFDKSPKLRGLPIALKRIDIHAEWISSSILSLMGTLPESVPGGKIMRHPDDDTPTGVFLDNAMGLVDFVRPQWTEKQMKMYLDRTVGDAVAKGVTGIHDAFGLPEHIEFYQRMADEGKLPIRFYIMRKCPDREKYCGDELPMIDNAGDGKLNVRSVKLFADGALGSWGAAMLEPYSDRPEETGIMVTPEEAWTGLIDDFVRNVSMQNVHCIGDRANRVVLDAMELAIAKYGPADRRLRIEHAQIMTEDDLARAVKLGVIGSYQPTHATSDMWYAEDRIGKDRLKGAYAWQTYIQLGGRIALGSDFPVESIDPLKGFFAAISRTDEAGDSPHGRDGWFPEQKLTRDQALRGFTIDAAYASFQENITGSFKVGKKFDAVIWDRDIMRVAPATEVLHAKVSATIVDGRPVYGSL